MWLIFLASLFALSPKAKAIDCPLTNYVIQTEAQLESFLTDIETCDVVLGSVDIANLYTPTARFLNLDLERINGPLRLTLTNLRGITSTTDTSNSQLTYVGELFINRNPELTGIYMDRLTAPPSDVYIADNDALHSVNLRHDPNSSELAEELTITPRND